MYNKYVIFNLNLLISLTKKNCFFFLNCQKFHIKNGNNDHILFLFFKVFLKRIIVKIMLYVASFVAIVMFYLFD